MIDPEEVLAAGARMKLVEGLTREQVRAFLLLGTPCRVEAGARIVDQGAVNSVMHILLRGKLRITRRPRSGEDPGGADEEMLFEPEVPKMMGAFPFRYMNLVAGVPRSASVSAVTESTVLTIVREDFEALCERDARLGYVLTRNIARFMATDMIQRLAAEK